jgi:hypothetical protein
MLSSTPGSVSPILRTVSKLIVLLGIGQHDSLGLSACRHNRPYYIHWANRKPPIRLPPIFARRLAPHVDAVGVVHQSVEDAVGQRGIADLFVPARDRQLRRQDRGTHLVAILANLPEVAALGL